MKKNLDEQPDRDRDGTILFVHGAFHGAWIWRELLNHWVIPGWHLDTVDLPSVAAKGEARYSLTDDVSAVRQHLSSSGPTVVVAHSYGGAVATQAAAGLAAVRHIVYLAAFQLDIGESLLGLAGGRPQWWIVDEDTIFPDNPVDTFYSDVSPELAEWATARLEPLTYSAVTEPLSAAAWRDIPSTYVVCEDDRALARAAQEYMAARATTVKHLTSSHSPMLSQPLVVGRIITEAISSIG